MNRRDLFKCFVSSAGTAAVVSKMPVAVSERDTFVLEMPGELTSHKYRYLLEMWDKVWQHLPEGRRPMILILDGGAKLSVLREGEK